MCVMPDTGSSEDFPTLRENELNRIKEFAEDAINSEQIIELLELENKDGNS